MFHPPSQHEPIFFHSLDKVLDVYFNDEKVVLVRDFDAKIRKRVLTTCFSMNLKVQIRNPVAL